VSIKSTRRYCFHFAFILLLTAAAGAQSVPQQLAAARKTADGILFQVSTLDALSSGVYGSSISVGEVKRHGDFGVGTFEGLDGEMIVLDGHYYHMRANGVLSEASDSEGTPFVAVTHFKPDVQVSVRGVTFAQLGTLIDALLPSKNLFYAVKVHGPFTAMTTRAIARQFLPYPPLAQLIPSQNVFAYTNIVGTAVGLRSPAFVAGINQVGYHFHFVSDDLKTGGHALDFTAGEVTVEIQILRQQSIWLPEDEPFLTATLPAAAP
jgi:acetolactate decarboxylase